MNLPSAMKLCTITWYLPTCNRVPAGIAPGGKGGAFNESIPTGTGGKVWPMPCCSGIRFCLGACCMALCIRGKMEQREKEMEKPQRHCREPFYTKSVFSQKAGCHKPIRAMLQQRSPYWSVEWIMLLFTWLVALDKVFVAIPFDILFICFRSSDLSFLPEIVHCLAVCDCIAIALKLQFLSNHEARSCE